jgi:hypothetical protein
MLSLTILAQGGAHASGAPQACPVVIDAPASLACLQHLIPDLTVQGETASWRGRPGRVTPLGMVVLEVEEGGFGGGVWLVGSEWGVVGGRWSDEGRGPIADLRGLLGAATVTDARLAGAVLGSLEASAAGVSAPLVGSGVLDGWPDALTIPDGAFALVGTYGDGVPAWRVQSAADVGGAWVVSGDRGDHAALAVGLRQALPDVAVATFQQEDRVLVLWGLMADAAQSTTEAPDHGSSAPDTGWDVTSWYRGSVSMDGPEHHLVDAWSLEALSVVNEARAELGLEPVNRDVDGSLVLLQECGLNGRLPDLASLWRAGPEVLEVVLDPALAEIAVCFGQHGWAVDGHGATVVRGAMTSGPVEVSVGNHLTPDAPLANATLYPPRAWWPEDFLLAWFPRSVSGGLTWSWSGGGSGDMSGDGRRFSAAVPRRGDPGEWRVTGFLEAGGYRAPLMLNAVADGAAPACGADPALDWLAVRVREGLSMEAARLLIAGVEPAPLVAAAGRMGCVGEEPVLAVRGHGPR